MCIPLLSTGDVNEQNRLYPYDSKLFEFQI